MHDILNERRFVEIMREHGVPTLPFIDHPLLAANELMFPYIPDSPTVGKHLSPDAYRHWGRTARRMHAIEDSGARRLAPDGEWENESWPDFIQSEIAYGIMRVTERRSDICRAERDSICRVLEFLTQDYRPRAYALVHGDLHPNNALIKNNEVLIFDKASQIFFGDPLYDLAVVALELPYGRYLDPDSTEQRKYSLCYDAFWEGYGANREMPWDVFDRYVLLRAFTRYPNPFERKLKAIIDTLVYRYS